MSEYSGKLIVVEGIDGSGKSSQIYLLKNWLENNQESVILSEWNSSKYIRPIIKNAKQKRMFVPITYSYLHATDFAERYVTKILPALQAGMTVLCDRYIYTAFARDAARGRHVDQVQRLYSYATKPDLVFYFRIHEADALKRITESGREISYYEAGMDMNFIPGSISENYKIFQRRVIDQYEKLVKAHNFVVLDATLDIQSLQLIMRKHYLDLK